VFPLPPLLWLREQTGERRFREDRCSLAQAEGEGLNGATMPLRADEVIE